ncbi:MAG: ABC transporter ATP-binding protein [Candidatus Omnitrophica bacterium]|nr:ABC transporter ATP-binding protein [Candidatus Omnitrophota bacterium]
MPGIKIKDSVQSFLGDLKTILRYSKDILKKYRGQLNLAMVLKMISFPLGLSLIYIAKTTLDKGLLGKDLGIFLGLTCLGTVIFLANRALNHFSTISVHKVKSSFSRDINSDLLRRLFGLDYQKIRSLSSADNTYVLDYDYGVIEDLIFSEIPSLASLVKVPVLFILASMLSWKLTLLVIAGFPFVILHTLWAARKRRKYRFREIYYARKHNSLLYDILINMKLIKSYSKEEWASGKISSLFSTRVDKSLQSILFHHKSRFISDLFTKLATAAFALLGGYMIINGSLSLGTFSAVSMYVVLIISEAYNAGSVLQMVNSERPSLKRNAKFIKEITERSEKSYQEPCIKGPVFKENINFNKISFGYSPGKTLFEDLSLDVPAGEWTLVRGPSGAGKTTLLSLLLGLFSPGDGNISIGGTIITDIDRGVFSRNVASVHQTPYLLNDTIMNNILLGEDEKKLALEKALYCTSLDDIARGLDLGYNSRVGEAGASFSGGQRQRIAIARALARGPQVLILDEATSFIDPETEERIFKRIKKTFPGITVVYVTHRSAAEEFADEIFVLEEGRVKNVGAKNFSPC